MLPRVVVIAVLALFGTLLSPAPAQAVLTRYTYVASAGATKLTLLDGTVQSDETALTAIVGGHVPVSDGNTVLSANIAGLLSTGAVTTKTSADAAGDGVKLTSVAQTAGVSLLNGAIRATAVKTTSVATMNSAGSSSSATTEFVGLHIAGHNIPVNIPENLTLTIPKVATVIINGAANGTTEKGTTSIAWGIGIRLLSPAGQFPAGTTLHLNPTYAAMAPDPPPVEGPLLGGAAYATKVDVQAGDGVRIWSGPTARVGIPATGTDGQTRTNSTAAVRLPDLLNTGLVQSTANGLREPTKGVARTSCELANLSLLGGLIRADLIRVVSRTELIDGVRKTTLTPTFVNLKVGNIVVPANVGPNTTINVANLGRVVVNHQVKTAAGGAIRGLLIVLNTSRAGLPVGAVIEIATASSAVRVAS